MSIAFKRILLVTHNVQFAIDTKRALESLGTYEVTTVTDTSYAIERLQNQRHHLVILDVEHGDVLPPDIVADVRVTQKDIAIILAPDLPEINDFARQLDVQGVVDIPMPSRSLIPIIEASVRDIYDNLPETSKAPAVEVTGDTRLIETLVDDLLGYDETPYFTSRQVRAQKPKFSDTNEQGTADSTRESNAIELLIEADDDGETVSYVEHTGQDRSLQLFQKLAQEEPPMPEFKDSSTVGDLARSVTQSKINSRLSADDETELKSSDDDDELEQSQPALLVLQTVLEETTPIDAISLDKLFANVEQRLPEEKRNIKPLPSWLKEGQKFIREPIFLQDELPSLDSQRVIEYTSTLTQPSGSADFVSNAADLETEVIESDTGHPTSNADDVIDLGEFMSDVDEDVAEAEETDFDDVEAVVDAEASTDDEAVSEPLEEEIDESLEEDSSQGEPLISRQDPIVEPEPQPDDPYLAQMAVTLTQVSNELTAEATILTRGDDIVAYSGDMPMDDIESLRFELHGDWRARPEKSRLRFINLPSNGREYMVYSKGTVGGFTLSMVFAGSKQLRIIRQQGQRLIKALEAVADDGVVEDSEAIEKADLSDIVPIENRGTPHADDVEVSQDSPDDIESNSPAMLTEMFDEPQVDEEEPVDLGPKHPFTFIWIVDDFRVQLSEHVAKQLVFWLEVQLNGLYWTIHELDVHQDFIYLRADIPGEESPATLIRNLMVRSAQIALSEDEELPKNLWADAYLVLSPGRDMTDREIQRFLNFARGEL